MSDPHLTVGMPTALPVESRATTPTSSTPWNGRTLTDITHSSETVGSSSAIASSLAPIIPQEGPPLAINSTLTTKRSVKPKGIISKRTDLTKGIQTGFVLAPQIEEKRRAITENPDGGTPQQKQELAGLLIAEHTMNDKSDPQHGPGNVFVASEERYVIVDPPAHMTMILNLPDLPIEKNSDEISAVTSEALASPALTEDAKKTLTECQQDNSIGTPSPEESIAILQKGEEAMIRLGASPKILHQTIADLAAQEDAEKIPQQLENTNSQIYGITKQVYKELYGKLTPTIEYGSIQKALANIFALSRFEMGVYRNPEEAHTPLFHMIEFNNGGRLWETSGGRLTAKAPKNTANETEWLKSEILRSTTISEEKKRVLLHKIDSRDVTFITEEILQEAQREADQLVEQFKQWFDKRIEELLKEKEKKELHEPLTETKEGFTLKQAQESHESLQSEITQELVLQQIANLSAQNNKAELAEAIKRYKEEARIFHETIEQLDKAAQKLSLIVLKEVIKFFQHKQEIVQTGKKQATASL